jgi:hypothetical protein
LTAKGWDWVKRVFGWRTWLVLCLLALFAFAGPLDAIVRYWNFTTLTKAHVVEEARAYARERLSSPVTYICIYEVDCSGEAAVLRLVENIDTWDFEAAKTRIWDRRFNNTCSGRTSNFGLHILAGADEIDSKTHARWFFFGNRFYPKHTRFGGGAFSEEPWERCTSERATIRLQSVR